MSLPLYENGPLAALLLGLFFGLALEGAGFASPRKLTAQFTLQDFSVLKVMMGAVVVAALGLLILDRLGVVTRGEIYIPTLYFGAFAAGGALIGTGFVIGGYCPGTSAVGLASGRLDALPFIAGMIAGVWLFAGFFEPLEAFYLAGRGPDRQTVDQLLGLPQEAIVALLALAAVGLFWLGARLERRFGGPLSASRIARGMEAGEEREQDRSLPSKGAESGAF